MENDRTTPRGSLISIGEKLKAAREKKNLTIGQLQKQSHIYSTILTALEEGRCDEILPVTYVKSFLKKYASHLGLDSGEIVKTYMALHPEESAPAKNPIGLNKIEDNKSDIFSKFIYAVSFALLFIAFLYLMTFLTKKIMYVFKKSNTARTVLVAKSKPATAPRATTQKKVVSKSKEDREISIPDRVQLNLTLKVNRPVTIGVKRDGVLLFKRYMQKGTVESFTAENKIDIYVAKAEAIELTLNGKQLGIPAKGLIKDLEITRKGIKIK